MNENVIVAQSNIKPASFVSDKGLTASQRALIKLLIDKITENGVITKDDIVRLYLQVQPRTAGIYAGSGKSVYQRIQTISLSEGDGYSTSRAMQWFKSNLGSCIIKGGLLVVPVIDIN